MCFPVLFADKMGEKYNVRGTSGVSALVVVVSANCYVTKNSETSV
jgi:hypothetical protein